MRLESICLWCSLCLNGIYGLVSAAHAQEPGDYLRLTVDGSAVPYKSTVYAVEVTQRVVSARATFQHENRTGNITRLTLLPAADWLRFVDEMRTHDLFELTSNSRPSRVDYTFEYRVGETLGRWRLSEAYLLSQPNVWLTLRSFRSAIREITPPVIFWDGDLPDEDSGRLRITSIPRAWVFIDDIPLRSQTPIRGIRALTGKHQVRLVDPTNGSEWTYPVLIRRGVTTQLDVELK
jgi:hypothetical protein